MAQMIPASLENLVHTTAGERKTFDILRKALPESVIVRYEMFLGQRDRRPDFLILDPDRGVLILEIKDWGVESIVEASQEQFLVKGYHGSSIPKPNMNPDLKCQIYCLEARQQMLAMPELRNGLDVKVPINYALAFPNISEEEFRRERLDRVLPGTVLLKEKLAKDGNAFRQAYETLLPALESPLEERQQRAIVAALLPDLKIPIKVGFEKQESGRVHSDATHISWYTISLEQEQVAKSLGDGHRLLRGIAGTGKTLIMLYRAKLLLANDPKLRILVLCWNTSLANYMRQLYEDLSIEIPAEARKQVRIEHFSDFLRNLLAKHNRGYADFDDPKFLRWLQSVPVRPEEQYDAVYIDEAQDFRKEWIEFLYNKMIRGEVGQRSLIISADDAQRIYPQRDFQWADLDFPEQVTARGRSRILKTIYRNSARVWTFAAFLQPDRAAYLTDGDKHVEFSAKGGYDPQLIECRSLEDQIEQAVSIVKQFKEMGYANRNVLILYRHRNFKGVPIVEHLRHRLQQSDIPNDWISENREAKSTFDWQADSVKISTVHSSKGMDSPVVIVLGAETFVSLGNDIYDEIKLMYVGLTRAREVLVVLYHGSGGLVPQLLECRRHYVEYKDTIVGFEAN